MAYKLAWILRKCVWYAPWPHLDGALAAVWVDGRVLLVRNSYNDYFSLPGGRLDQAESFAAAAARELQEETGIVVHASDLAPMRSEDMARPLGRARVEIFQTLLAATPVVTPDPVEIAEFRWSTRTEAEKLALFAPVRRYLRENGGDRKQFTESSRTN